MARATFSATDLIDCGSGSTLDNLAAATVLSWWTLPNNTTGTLFAKSTSTARIRLQHSTSGLGLEYGRATTILNVAATDANCPGVGLNKWVFTCITWNDALTDADQKLFTGDRNTNCAEPSAYTTQLVGSGAKGDDSADSLQLGRFGAASSPWTGSIGIVQVLNVQISLPVARSWQWAPRWLPNTVGLWIPGWDNGTTVPDLSGNGNAGTITGTTLAPDFPYLPSIFGAAEDDDMEYLPGAPPSGAYFRHMLEVSI